MQAGANGPKQGTAFSRISTIANVLQHKSTILPNNEEAYG